MGGGELALASELEGFDGGRLFSSVEDRPYMGLPCGGEGKSEYRLSPIPKLRTLALLPPRKCIVLSSLTDRKAGEKLPPGEELDRGGSTNWSCSALVALRTQSVLPISVTVEDTWLAAASNKLTGDMPLLVACVLEAVTRLLNVASMRSCKAWSVSVSISLRSLRDLRSNILISSTIAVTAFTTAFIGVRTRVGALERPAVRRLSIADTKAVT